MVIIMYNLIFTVLHTIASQEVVKIHEVESIDTCFIVTSSKIGPNIIQGIAAVTMRTVVNGKLTSLNE